MRAGIAAIRSDTSKMLEDILEKRDILNARKPFPRDVSVVLDKLNMFDFLYNDLKLDGSNLTEEGVGRILEGGMAPGASIREHNELPLHIAAFKLFDEMRHMYLTMDRQRMGELYCALCGGQRQEFRRKTPILYHLDFTPPYYTEIPALLDELFRLSYRGPYDGDFIRRAADMHNGIIAIYPYEERSEALARSVFQYELIRGGLFPVRFGVSEQDYNMLVTQAVKDGFGEPFYRMSLRAVEKKMDKALSLFQ